MEQAQDNLTALARSIVSHKSGEAYSQLVVRGRGDAEAMELLEKLSGDFLIETVTRSAGEPLAALRAGLWLWHDFLDESHRISQQISSATGSFWHAIMHRREGDFSNSKYWYARCEEHPVMQALGAQAGLILNPLPADKGLLRVNFNGWNPNAFVDLVEELEDHPEDPRRAAAVELQRMEWRLLFDYCVRQASGR